VAVLVLHCAAWLRPACVTYTNACVSCSTQLDRCAVLHADELCGRRAYRFARKRRLSRGALNCHSASQPEALSAGEEHEQPLSLCLSFLARGRGAFAPSHTPMPSQQPPAGGASAPPPPHAPNLGTAWAFRALGLSRDATRADAKRAYHRCARSGGFSLSSVDHQAALCGGARHSLFAASAVT
jgi:hypothetical protein